MKKTDCNYVSGAYDRCLECQYLGNGCDGPRTTSMSNERWVWWVKALKTLRGYTNQDCIEGTGLSKATIESIFAGNLKDVKRSTVGMLEDFLIGSSGTWPCAMDLNKDKDVVYMDKPETIAMLQERAIQVENLRRNYDDIKDSVDREMERVRTEYIDDIKFYREHIQLLRDQLKRKDRYIDLLISKTENIKEPEGEEDKT